MNKLHFLQHEFVNMLNKIPAETPATFGKMNVHQMIEHMSYAFKQASGLIPLDAANNEEVTSKMYNFMMSEKPFRDNTPNPYLPDEPEAPFHSSIHESLDNLQMDINFFIETFQHQSEEKVLNPFFGHLNFEERVHLLYKHALHHLRQFGINQI